MGPGRNAVKTRTSWKAQDVASGGKLKFLTWEKLRITLSVPKGQKSKDPYSVLGRPNLPE